MNTESVRIPPKYRIEPQVREAARRRCAFVHTIAFRIALRKERAQRENAMKRRIGASLAASAGAAADWVFETPISRGG
jgi:hypothetical protein